MHQNRCILHLTVVVHIYKGDTMQSKKEIEKILAQTRKKLAKTLTAIAALERQLDSQTQIAELEQNSREYQKMIAVRFDLVEKYKEHDAFVRINADLQKELNQLY